MSTIRKCAVKNCVYDESVTYHRIPKDFATRNDWLNLLCLPPTTSNRVCSKHFNPLDFVVKDDGHIWLKKNAYPFPVIITSEPFENEVEVEYTPLKYID
ncbi:hypothetical protein Bhyg_06628 [Pseudolycoriella hygida]|uniref:THAP-type domain-containing protein n=1 Tax=Pseudolycoriella hygida TaxID=35572 RepID=A0A9Q0N109_9DIPT|nr:hypothetical protein Bhyg_06628 [Pseudolycoriella hygida]